MRTRTEETAELARRLHPSESLVTVRFAAPHVAPGKHKAVNRIDVCSNRPVAARRASDALVMATSSAAVLVRNLCARGYFAFAEPFHG